jgi:DNA repair photolyase
MPGILRIPRSEWGRKPKLASNILALLKDELPTLPANHEIMLATSSDPFQPSVAELSCKIVELFVEYNARFRVLSKNVRVLDLIPIVEGYDPSRYRIGVTITTINEDLHVRWQPKASLYTELIFVLHTLHQDGIPAWLSLEPMLPKSRPIVIVQMLQPFVEEIIIGRLNHVKGAPSDDWCLFQMYNIKALADVGGYQDKIRFKKELHDIWDEALKAGKNPGGFQTLEAFLKG